MTVQATKLVNRDIYELSYEGAVGTGQINARMENPASGDVSSYIGPDDGQFTVTVGKDYTGEADITITNEAGDTVDTGHVVYGQEANEHPDTPPALPEPLPPFQPAHPIAGPEE